jgi:hypothetical protein
MQHRAIPILCRAPPPCTPSVSSTWWTRAAFSLTALLATSTSYALDLAGANAPLEVRDGKVTSGSRTLLLPQGHWFLVHRSEGSVTNGNNRTAPSDVAELALVDDGELVAIARLGILRADLSMKSWNNTPCNVRPEEVYRRDRGGLSGQPDCLSITGQRTTDVDSYIDREFSRSSLQWLSGQGVRLPEYTVSILYARFATNTFGSVLLLASAERFQNADAAVDWAEALRTALKSMFEHRDSEAGLPSLPPRAEPDVPGAAAAR